MIPHVNKYEEDLEDSELAYNLEKTRKIKWQDQLLLNRPLKVVVVFILAAVVAPLLIYRYLFFTNINLPPSDGFSFGSCLISRQSRLPCGYGNVTADKCHTECCYDHTNGVCFHRFPSRFSYILDGKWSEDVILTSRIPTVPYGSQKSFTNIKLSIDEVSATHLSLTFYKADETITGRRVEEKDYVYEVSQGELNIIVNAPQGSIFNTARGPLIASNDIWEMAFKVTNESMYGLDEIPLKENTTKVIYSHRGGLSAIPLIFAKSNGSYHGLLFETKAPTEIHIRSENQLIVRSITNWGLKFHLFVGPRPAHIMRDVLNLIGGGKKLEYGMLGTHICSELPTSDSLADLQTFINDASEESMPFESHCGVVPPVFSSTCDGDYVKLVDEGATVLRQARKKFVPHISPYIRYKKLEIHETGEDESAEFKEDEEHADREENDETTELSPIERCFDEEKYKDYIIQDVDSEYMYIGTVDEHNVIYPNYDNITEEFMQQLWIYDDYDGVVLEDNWPLDESSKMVNETHLYLPYFTEDFQVAFENTPKWNVTQSERYLYTHNEYGNHFISAFKMIYKDAPIASTSQWMNGDVIINRQGIKTSWSSLQKELVSASLAGISGHWYWSSPVCGDTEDFNNSTQIKLCAKWYMAATYFPMIQIKSKEVRRDPLAFEGTDKAHMITALRRRMSLLPYFYTVLQEGPLLRPMFYQFPYTEEITNITTQFSVGDDLLIVPNLQPSQSHVHVSMPPGIWYELWGGLKIEGDVGEVVTMTTTEADFLTLIRGGSIIAMHEHNRLTTAETQLMSTYAVVIALHCEMRNITEDETTTDYIGKADIDSMTTDIPATAAEPTSTLNPINNVCSAKGKLYMTSEMIISFEADNEVLIITAIGDNFEVLCDWNDATWASDIWNIKIYGLDEDQNNFDNHRHLQTNINLCSLQTEKEITYNFV